MNKKLQGQIRHILGIAGAYMVTTGELTEGDSVAIIGVIMAVVAMAWSYFAPEKKAS